MQHKAVAKPTVTRTTKTIKAHQPERPKTLMRRAVHKPKAGLKPAIKTTSPSEVMARPVSSLVSSLEKKLSASQVNPVRLSRSRQVAKSHHIHRFTNPKQAREVAHSIQRPNTMQTVQAAPSIPRAAHHDSHNAGVSARANTLNLRQVQTSRNQQSTTDIFEAALAHATSHEQRTPKAARYQASRKKRLINAFAGLGALLLIVGFVAYLNKSTIELRVASMRAGFSAQMPSYKPAGFELSGNIESQEGKVSMSFRSGDSAYTIVQEASDWNSSTLVDQTAEKRGTPSRTVQSKGRTIYFYNDQVASWVNGGVRYEISGNAALDADEMVSLATSM